MLLNIARSADPVVEYMKDMLLAAEKCHRQEESEIRVIVMSEFESLCAEETRGLLPFSLVDPNYDYFGLGRG